MLYSELLPRLRQSGVDEVGRQQDDTDLLIFLARPKEVIFPHRFQVHPIWAPVGAADFDVHPEEILAILRRFRIDKKGFGPL